MSVDQLQNAFELTNHIQSHLRTLVLPSQFLPLAYLKMVQILQQRKEREEIAQEHVTLVQHPKPQSGDEVQMVHERKGF